MSFKESQFRETIWQKMADALAAPAPALTHRDVRLPAVPRKALAVIGMRRAGSDRLTKVQRSSLEKDLLGYLAAGGFPGAQGPRVGKGLPTYLNSLPSS